MVDGESVKRPMASVVSLHQLSSKDHQLSWSPWSDSHRRIRVYETRPVAAEAQGLGNVEWRRRSAERASGRPWIPHSGFRVPHSRWRSHVDLHHEPPPSQSGVQNLLTP